MDTCLAGKGASSEEGGSAREKVGEAGGITSLG